MEWHYLEDALLAIEVEEDEWGIPQFSAYQIEGWDDSGNNEHTLDPDCLFCGRVRRGGCSDWSFRYGAEVVHYCSKGQMKQISAGMEWCYEYAKAHIEGFCGD